MAELTHVFAKIRKIPPINITRTRKNKPNWNQNK